MRRHLGLLREKPRIWQRMQKWIIAIGKSRPTFDRAVWESMKFLIDSRYGGIVYSNHFKDNFVNFCRQVSRDFFALTAARKASILTSDTIFL